MSKIQETLNELQPYVIGIRYLEGTVLVDVVFKEGWTIPEDEKIKKAKDEKYTNYFMLFSDNPSIGLDELLDYVRKTIKINLEREEKHALLKAKVEDLKQLFKKTPLQQLYNLKFVFGEKDLVPSLNDFDVDIDLDVMDNTPTITEEVKYPKNVEEYSEEEVVEPTIPETYLDENNQPIQLTEEELEIIEEEKRAARNMKMANKRGKKLTTESLSSKIELPPKKAVIANDELSDFGDCDCGPNEACSKCIDLK